MPVKTDTSKAVGAAVTALGKVVAALVHATETRDARKQARAAWSAVPSADDALTALVTLAVPTDDAVSPDALVECLVAVEYIRDVVLRDSVGADLSAAIAAVHDASRPIAAVIESAPMLGHEVHESWQPALDAAAAAVTAAGAAVSKPRTPGSTARATTEKPWEDAGPLVRMVVTGPDGTRVARKASQKASVFSSTKDKWGATLPQLSGSNLAVEYAAAFEGHPQTITTSAGTFTMAREG